VAGGDGSPSTGLQVAIASLTELMGVGDLALTEVPVDLGAAAR
jgi:hypothetical protein